MKYLFLLIGDESTWTDATEEERERIYAQYGRLDEELKAAGKQVEGYELAPSSAATKVVYSGEQRTVLDGPFAETREQIGGYYVFDCADLDEALAWADKIPHGDGVIEIRPIVEYEG